MYGTVHLVGTGPGNPGLVTRRALEVLATAEVVVYDRLIPAALAATAPTTAELVDVGKRAGAHTMRQEEINALIVRRALEGRIVVRLKGGDPFLFGRGGEEEAACLAAGIRVEIVPGVTSAISVPAFAGIPVTHRGVSNLVTIVTASSGEDGQGDPDYEWLARCPGTVVLLMGLRRLARVATQLIEHGAPSDRPVAVISKGTTQSQRTVTGVLATITHEVEAAGLQSPAIIVVGDVVKLREELSWFEQRPLFGRSITVTRARAQASELVTSLEGMGAHVIECPTIRIDAMDSAELDAEIDRIATRDMIVLTSRNAAEILFARLAAKMLDCRVLGGIRIAVVGAGTAEVFAGHGITVDVVPTPGRRTGVGLLETLSAEPIYGASVLLILGEDANPALARGIADRGGQVTSVPVYRNVVDIPEARVVMDALASDWVTFTSASTVRNFAALLPDGVPRPAAVTIGPRTTEAALAAGFSVAAEAADPSVGGVIVALLRLLDSGADADGDLPTDEEDDDGGE